MYSCSFKVEWQMSFNSPKQALINAGVDYLNFFAVYISSASFASFKTVKQRPGSVLPPCGQTTVIGHVIIDRKTVLCTYSTQK